MRGGYLGHVLVFAIAVRLVFCFFVCAVCLCVLFARFGGDCCSVLGVVMYARRFSWSFIGVFFVYRRSFCHCYFVNVGCFACLFVLFAMFDGLCLLFVSRCSVRVTVLLVMSRRV